MTFNDQIDVWKMCGKKFLIEKKENTTRWYDKKYEKVFERAYQTKNEQFNLRKIFYNSIDQSTNPR